MPTFKYTGRDLSGSLVQGTLDSENSNALASLLFSRNITPLEINPQKEATSSKNISINSLKKKLKPLM
jgi:type II secretory pathway component PulF